MKNALKLILAVCLMLFGIAAAIAAEDLQLAPGLSYTSDSGPFPIIATNLHDAKIEAGRPHLIFFGAASDLNTNRQAKRFVDLYKKQKQKDTTLKFIVVDVDRPASPEAKELISKYYPGYVPAELLLDKDGKTVWSHVGEVSRRKIRARVGGTL
jgi:hypothetical protein